MLVFGVMVLLAMFCFVSHHTCHESVTLNVHPSVSEPAAALGIGNLRGVVFVVVVITNIMLDNILPKVGTFRGTSKDIVDIPVFQDMELTIPALVRVIVVLITTFLSFGAAGSRIHAGGRFA